MRSRGLSRPTCPREARLFPGSQRITDLARSSDDEAALVERALDGDRGAYGALVERYAPEVRRVARAVLRDPDEADDAAQDAFLAALIRLHQYDPARPFGPWLLRIVANAATDRRRRANVRRTAARDESRSGAGAGIAPIGASPDVDTEREELAKRLGDALERLPVRRRLAVVLFDLEGYSHADIAGILGVREGTVRSEVFHARRALRRELAGWKTENDETKNGEAPGSPRPARFRPRLGVARDPGGRAP